MKLRKTQLSFHLKKMSGNGSQGGNYADLNLNQSGQYGQIYAEKFTSVSLICKVFYGKMKAQ